MNVGRLALDALDRYGEYTALHFAGHSYTNLDRARWATSLAAVLREHGVGPGDRVMVMMPNCPEVTGAFQAIWKLGAVIVPVTPQLGPKEVRYLLEDSEAPWVITSPLLADRVAEASSGLPSFRELLVTGPSDVDSAQDLSPGIAEAEGTQPLDALVDRSDDDLALLLYTSGTTGHPKGVMLSHGNMTSNARSVAASNPSIEPHEVSLHVLPLSHSFGVLMMNLGFIFGSVSALLPHFDPTTALENIERYRVRRMSVVPTMLTYLLRHPERDKFDTSSLAKVASGGAALPNDLRVEFERVFDCEVRDGYGMSECAPSATGYREGDEYRPGSVGRAIQDVEVAILDDDDRELPRGEWGEICIRGPNVMKGYLNKPEATEEALRNGWLHSGDIGYMDEDGFVYITDRKKDLIIKGGENISAREIEEAIWEHPAVAECAVIGVPDATYGEDLCAVVVLKPGASADEDEIRARAAEAVTRFKVPSRVVFVDDLPKSPIGKILKKELRRGLADGSL